MALEMVALSPSRLQCLQQKVGPTGSQDDQAKTVLQFLRKFEEGRITLITDTQSVNDKKKSTRQMMLRKENGAIQQYPQPLRSRNNLLNDHFLSLVEVLGSKDELLAQLEFFFGHPPKDAILTAEDMLGVLEKAGGGGALREKAFALVATHLDLSAPKVLQLKDETHLSNDGIHQWMEKLEGLVCSKADLARHFAKEKETFRKVLEPKKTPGGGYSVSLERLLFLLEAAKPVLLGEKLLIGVNVDATSLAGVQTTATSIRPLNEVLQEVGAVNSKENEFTIAIHPGADDEIGLRENIFNSRVPGSLGQYLEDPEKAKGIFYLLDGKTAHSAAGLKAHNSLEHFQLSTKPL